MKREQGVAYSNVVGGVDTHKDLHVAAIVDEHDLVLGSECFPSTRHCSVVAILRPYAAAEKGLLFAADYI